MKTATIIARGLLGLIFVVFGSNLLLHFIPMPAPAGQAGAFFGALYQTHYVYVSLNEQAGCAGGRSGCERQSRHLRPVGSGKM